MTIKDILIRVLLAALVGGIIGYERENKNRPAGFRTHILVCLGATVVSMIQLYDIEYTIKLVQGSTELSNVLKADVGRLGAQVITGIGFIGAGTIIHEKGSVKGLTTAASLWTVGCIGLAVGKGYYSLSIISALSVICVLEFLKKFENAFREKCTIVRFQVDYNDKELSVTGITHYFQENGIKIKNIEFFLEDDVKGQGSSLYTVSLPRRAHREEIIMELRRNSGIDSVEIL
ncbi:MgtC/SapB family protein [Clostridium malenominatum]|uniref:MgtC/SapB family protein n=1 Tax=Clostridium malenominatum TaxID=1539 RepID=A0ABP3UD92_9CLOT